MAEQTLNDVQAKGAQGKICYFNVADFQEIQAQIDGCWKNGVGSMS